MRFIWSWSSRRALTSGLSLWPQRDPPWFSVGREAMLLEMGIALRDDSSLMGVYSPKRVRNNRGYGLGWNFRGRGGGKCGRHFVDIFNAAGRSSFESIAPVLLFTVSRKTTLTITNNKSSTSIRPLGSSTPPPTFYFSSKSTPMLTNSRGYDEKNTELDN